MRAAVVLAAGDLAVLAREPAERGEGAPTAAAPPADTILTIGDDEHLLAVVAGPHALLPLLEHDLATLLADMRAGGLAEGASSRVQVLERADSAVSAAIFAGLGIPAAGKA